MNLEIVKMISISLISFTLLFEMADHILSKIPNLYAISAENNTENEILGHFLNTSVRLLELSSTSIYRGLIKIMGVIDSVNYLCSVLLVPFPAWDWGEEMFFGDLIDPTEVDDHRPPPRSDRRPTTSLFSPTIRVGTHT